MKRFFLVLVLVLITSEAFALPMTAKLSWTMPTTTMDGQPINADTAVTGSKVYCGSASGKYTITKVVAAGINVEPVIDVPLTIGNWYCVVTVSNKYGESGYSNEKAFTIDGAVPSAPINLDVIP